MPVLSQAEARRKRTGATPPRKMSPGQRSPEGQFGLYNLRADSLRKGFHYKWGYIGGVEAMAEARASGYRQVKWEFSKRGNKVERSKKDDTIVVSGPCPMGAEPELEDEGRPIRVGDQVLLACSGQRRADIEEWGQDGTTGQVGADAIEERIIRKKGGTDRFRGMKVNHGGKHHMAEAEWGESGMQHGEATRGL